MSFSTRKFYSLLFTSSVAMAIAFIMLLSDTVIAGQFIGENAIAGVNLVLPVFSMAAFVSALFSVGTSASYSYEMGKFQKDRADEFFGQGILLAVSGGVILFLLTAFGKELYFQALAPSAEVLECASAYYTYYPYIVLTYPIFMLLADMVYADGDELVCNLAYGIQIIGNILSSILLCRFIGLKGIGLGTLIGILLGSFVLVLHFLRKGNSLRFHWHMKLRDVLHVAKFGVTDAEQYLSVALLLYGLNRFVIARFGSTVLPALSVLVSIVELTIVFDGIGQALSPLIGVYRGENNAPGIRGIMHTAQWAAVVEGLAFSAALLIFAESVPSLFGITDPETIAMSAAAIRIVSLTMAFTALKYLYTSYYLYLEKLWLSVSMTLVSDLAAPLMVGIPLSIMFGINGLWIGFAAAPVLALVFGWLVVLIRYGRAKIPLLLSHKDDERYFTFNLTLTNESMIKLRDDVEELLKNSKTPQHTIYRIMLIIEEVCGLILLKNLGKKVYMECTIMMGDNVRLILRDSGVIFNITDADMEVSSWSAYVVSGIMEKQTHKHNLTTIGYNRNEFCFEY
jgi:Na+-driven multidrug efflux pump